MHKLDKIQLSSGKKYLYEVEKFSRIEDIFELYKIPINISKIKTGKRGKKLLEKYGSKFLDLVEVNSDFDPIVADHYINPFIDGYRLSSAMMYITNFDETIKLIPKIKYKIWQQKK